MKESRMLQVVGIIAIVFGGLGALGSILALVGGSVLGAVGGVVGGVGGLLILFSLISLATSGLYIWAGIMGVMHWRNPEQVKLLTNIGIAMIVLQAVSILLSLFISSFAITSLIGLAIPILYFLGAKQLAE